MGLLDGDAEGWNVSPGLDGEYVVGLKVVGLNVGNAEGLRVVGRGVGLTDGS